MSQTDRMVNDVVTTTKKHVALSNAKSAEGQHVMVSLMDAVEESVVPVDCDGDDSVTRLESEQVWRHISIFIYSP
jgi:hypothetical protein